MSALRPSAKIGIVLGGLAVAVAAACVAVAIRQHFTQGPGAQAASGMYAAGDVMLGVAVFGVAAFVPLALGLFWLRPVGRFWSALAWGAVLFALSGLGALAANLGSPRAAEGWILLSHVRIGLMPLGAMGCLACAAFAPQVRHRWLLFVSGATDGAVFAGIVVMKFILPSVGG